MPSYTTNMTPALVRNWWGKYANLNVSYWSKFLHLLAYNYFHNFMVYSTFFFLFKMLDGHLMHLITWKNLFLNTLFFLATTSGICIPHISQWTKTWKNINDKYFFRKWLDKIYRFFLNNSIPFIWENIKWKNLEF